MTILSPDMSDTVLLFYSLPMFPGLRHAVIFAMKTAVLLHRASHLSTEA